MRLARVHRGEALGARRTIKRLLAIGGVMAFKTAVQLTPRAWDPWLARSIWRTVTFLQPSLRRRIDDHLRLVYYGELSLAERRALADRISHKMGWGLTEFMRMGQTTSAEIERRCRVFGQNHLRRALAAGRGVILAAAHYGNFELMAAYCGSWDLPITVIARAKDDDLTEEFIRRTRSHHKINVIHKTAWPEAAKVLKAGGMVGILVDQAVNTGGVMIDFLGHPASAALGPLLLARQTGAMILPCFISRDANHRQTIEMHRPLEIPETGNLEADLIAAARELHGLIERQIRYQPDEWYWLHRRWKKPLKVRRSAPKLTRSLGSREPAEG